MSLKRTFVGMLFALAVAQAAILYGDLFKIIAYEWDYNMTISGFVDRITIESNLLIAPASHLFLGIVLVAQSWLGWSKSGEGKTQVDNQNLYGLPFLVLIIEVILVVLYFILINSVEINYGNFQSTAKLSDAIQYPSAAPEATVLFLIFGVYVLWDIFFDVILNPIVPEHMPIKERPNISKIVTFTTGTITHSFVSVICVIIAFYIQVRTNAVSTPNSAIFGDVALIALLFFFRFTKWVEPYFNYLFSWESKRNGARPLPDNAYKQLFWSLGWLSVIFIFTGIM